MTTHDRYRVPPKSACLACVAHPDDIEFFMAGTLIQLGRAGYEMHYMTSPTAVRLDSKLAAQKLATIRRTRRSRRGGADRR